MGDLIQGGSWLRHGVVVEDSTVGRASFVGFRVVLWHATVGVGVQIAARAQIVGTPERPVHVGDGAWIGVGAYIAPGVRLGEHSIVGAGSEVYDDVPAYTVSYGRPAFGRASVTTRFNQGEGIESVLELVSKRPKRDTARLFADGPADADAFFDCGATIGPNVTIGRAAIMIGRPDGPSPDGGITIGARATLGDWLIAEGGGGLSIGEDVVLGDGVTITTSSHDYRSPGRPWTAAPVHIAAGAAIGSGSTIVGPVRIGAGAHVTPGSVVTRSLAPDEISKGVFG